MLPAEDPERLAAESAADASAAGVGLILGSLAGGPIGVMAGAALGPPIRRVFRRVETELGTRPLGGRQRTRMGRAGRIALEEIARRLARGDRPRFDFLEDDDDGRCTAEELLEQAVAAAGDSADERKAPLFGHFYAAVLFDSEVNAAEARYLHGLIERLTHRQLVALAVIGEASDVGPDPFMRRYHDILDDGDVARLDPAVSLEMDDLADLHLIGVVERHDKRKQWIGHDPKVNSPYVIWREDTPDSIWQQVLGRVRATPTGHQAVRLYGGGIAPDERSAWTREAWRAIPREPIPSAPRP